MINCNEIKQEVDELKMKMSACTVLKAEDMQKLLDLLTALNTCKCNCGPIDLPIEIYSFQFETLTDNITNVDKLTDAFLDTNGLQHTEESMLIGKNIDFSNVGRIGFIIKNTEDNPYDIYDILNNNITNITFNTSYDSINNIFYYVSKEYYVPSSLYFKFIK